MRGMSSRRGHVAEASGVALRTMEDRSATVRPPRRTRQGPSYQSSIMLRFDSLLGADRGLYMFLRNEPNLFLRGFRCIDFRYRTLCRLQSAFAGGFVLENEPNLRGVLVGLNAVKGQTNPFVDRSVVERCYFFFSPHDLAMMASSEKQPGPKMRTITQVNRNRNGAAVTNLSGLLKMAWAASDSAVR